MTGQAIGDMDVMPSPVSPFVVRAATVAAHADAAAIRADAAAQGAALRARAEAERRQAVAAGHAEGHAEGLRSGLQRAASLASDAAATVEAFLQAREAELHELAFAIAHRVLASLPPDQVLARLVAEALAEHRREVRLTLRVCPADAGPLREALASAEPEARVVVAGDPAAAPGTCTLVHPGGRTRLGLVEQFRAMMADVA